MKVYNGIGPIKIDSLSSPKRLVRDDVNAITKKYHLLAIDFPCNIGFLNTTSNNQFLCPGYKNISGVIDFDALAESLAEGLKEFFDYKAPEYYLHNMRSLKVFIWTEGFGAQLAISLKTIGESTIGNNFKFKGIILGDAMIDMKRQTQNFASYGVGRSVISKEIFRELSKIESQLLLQSLTNTVLCNMFRNVSSKFDTTTTCPYDLSMSCSSLMNFIGTINNCDMFVAEKLETDVDNPLLKFLQDKVKIMRYNANPSMLLWPDYATNNNEPKLQLYNPKAIEQFVKVVNDLPVLLYQSQNNFIANSITSMLFADPLKWKFYDQYTSSPTVYHMIDPKDPKKKYTLRSFDNLNRAQIFNVGGIYTFRENMQIMRDEIFKEFTDKIN